MAMELAWQGTATQEEDRLALRCRSGDPTAFNEIVDRYQLRLFRFAFRLLRDRAEAEDAVQETFVRAYRSLPVYRPEGYFSSWIYRILLNECRRRARGRRAHIPLEYVDQADQRPDPEQTLLAQERNRRVRAAVDQLPDIYRIVLLLFYFEEMPVAGIAQTLDITISAVKVRLHRGRVRLSERLGSAF